MTTSRLLLPGLQKNLQDRKDKYCILTEKCGNIANMEDGDYVILNVQQFEACHDMMHAFDDLQSTIELIQHVYSVIRDLYFIVSQNPSLTLTFAQHAAAITKCIAFLKGMQVSNRLIPNAFRRHPNKTKLKSHKHNPHLFNWMELKEQVAKAADLSPFAQAKLFVKLYRTFSFMLAELLTREHNEGKEVSQHPLDKGTLKWMKKVEFFYAKFLIPHRVESKKTYSCPAVQENTREPVPTNSEKPREPRREYRSRHNTVDSRFETKRRERSRSPPVRERMAEKRRREDSRPPREDDHKRRAY